VVILIVIVIINYYNNYYTYTNTDIHIGLVLDLVTLKLTVTNVS